MRIDFVEIRNYRRLAAVRVALSDDTTVLVGANNSGKTSAMTALRCFLSYGDTRESSRGLPFSVYDIPLANWERINELGRTFEATEVPNTEVHSKWPELLPSLDVWLSVRDDEVHRVAHLIPTLDWAPENGLGMRLQLAPKDSRELLEAYYAARNAASAAASARTPSPPQENSAEAETTLDMEQSASPGTFSLWPKCLMNYLERHMTSALEVKAYVLDPAAKAPPENGMAKPQLLPVDAEPLEGRPLARLVRVDVVPAHRGLSDYTGRWRDLEDGETQGIDGRQPLTAQLRAYYTKHLDPDKAPEPNDVAALEAIHEAQTAFDERLRDRFAGPLDELGGLGYPGISNPRLVVSTQLRPQDGLNHRSAVQYEVASSSEQVNLACRLPEQCNGLGYQNLISMVFWLISFRDGWLKVGKASADPAGTPRDDAAPPPLHLVLLEEPEAHLHVQVQQVLIRKAHEVLRNHADLGEDSPLSTQLIVSTHSSHIAHEVEFEQVRYFRRHPVRSAGETPTSTVADLSEVFGPDSETERFVARYLRVTHADLFFADGVILIEGAAERILVPHFIREHFKELDSCYVTLLEIGGSHAHRLRPLIERLGVNTLIITDVDAVKPDGRRRSTLPARGGDLLTANNVLKTWHPQQSQLDTLYDLLASQKEKAYDGDFSIRVAYQTPVTVTLPLAEDAATVYPRTFEDALVMENLALFERTGAPGLLGKIHSAITSSTDTQQLLDRLSEATIDAGGSAKAAFALDVLYLDDLKRMHVPKYVAEGLEWLQERLLSRQQEVHVDAQESPALAPEEA